MRFARGFPNNGASAKTASARGSEFEVDNWELSAFVIKRLIPVVGVHPYPLNELMMMAAAVVFFRPTHVFEWGTHVGKSGRIFFETAREHGIRLDLHSIDLPDSVPRAEHPGRQRGKILRRLPNVFLHDGDGLSTSLAIYDGLPKPARPLFFLDGDHDYSSVRREIDGIVARVPNPVLLVHDTFYQSPDSGYNVGPFRAVAEFLDDPTTNFKRLDTATGLPGLTLLFPG